MPTFTHNIAVDAPFTRVWTLVSDVERIAALFPYCRLDAMEILSPERRRFWRYLSIPNIAEVQWREATHISAPGVMQFEAVEGDLTTFAGSWCVAADGETSSISLQLTFEVPEAFAPRVPAQLASYVIGEIFKSISGRIKEAAEQT